MYHPMPDCQEVSHLGFLFQPCAELLKTGLVMRNLDHPTLGCPFDHISEGQESLWATDPVDHPGHETNGGMTNTEERKLEAG